jgi:hypothetical protein
MLVDFDPPLRQVRQFARIWLPLFGVVFSGLLLYRGHSATLVGSVAGVVAVLTAGALASDAFARRVFITLLAVTAPIGWVVSMLLLAAIYFVILTPISLVRRARGADHLRLTRAPAGESYWEPRQHDERSDRAFSQF